MFLLVDGTAYPDTPSVLVLRLLRVLFRCHRSTQGPAAGIVNILMLLAKILLVCELKYHSHPHILACKLKFCLQFGYSVLLTHLFDTKFCMAVIHCCCWSHVKWDTYSS
jgi:phosphatidylserine synthase